MHLASVSKLITAMAMMVLFLDHKLDKGPGRRGPPIIQRIHPWEEAAISTYLPDNWQTGPNIENITFLDLLQHTSGLSTPPGPVTFQSIQSAIATGSTGLGTYQYHNVNYALCRILLPVINGDIDQGADQSIWDSKTQTAYATYVQDNRPLAWAAPHSFLNPTSHWPTGATRPIWHLAGTREVVTWRRAAAATAGISPSTSCSS